MIIINRIFYLLKIIFIFVIVYLICNRLILSYQSIEQASFNTDEYAIVYDSQIYKLRKAKNYEQFRFSKKNLKSNWASIEYRLIDMPQMGRYIFGYLISKSELDFNYQNPAVWFESDNQKFGKFGDMWNLTGGRSLNEIENLIGSNWRSIIIELRYYSFYVFLLFFMVHGFFIFKLFRSTILSFISIFIFVFNPLIEYYSQVATMDVYSLFFIYVSFIFIFYTFSLSKNVTVRKKYFLIFLAGMLTAISSSIKLNGLSLLFTPVIYLIYDLYNELLKNKKTNLDINFKLTIVFFTSFLLLFTYLEPEIVLSPINGLYILLISGLNNQQRLLHHFGTYNIFEYLQFLFQKFSWGYESLFLSISALAFSILGILFSIKKVFYDKKNYINLFLILFCLIANYYYARVGFDRYLFPSLIILNFFSIYSLFSITNLVKGYINE